MAKARKQKRQPTAARRPAPAAPLRTQSPFAKRYWALAIALAAVLVYANAIGGAFVFDDTRLIVDNPRIRSLADLPALFASSYWDLPGTQGLYRPLVLVSYAINYAVGGLSPAGYTAANIALHAATSVLLFGLVRVLGGSLLAAGMTGLLFAVHPVHTEAVAGISGRPELLAALFSLLAIHCHLRGAAPRAVWWRAVTALSFAAALLSKESAITLLLVLPAMDALFPDEETGGQTRSLVARRLRHYVLLVLVALGYLAARTAVLGGVVIDKGVIAPLDNPLVPVTTLPLGERLGATTSEALMTACAVVTQYAGLLLWPARLSPDYSYNQLPLVTSPLDFRFIVGVALMGACLAGVVFFWHRHPLAAFGLAFLALTYSVVSNFIVTIGTICAERLIYLPSAGALIAAATGAARLSTSGTRRYLVLVAAASLIALGAARTWERNRDWMSDRALWTSAIGVAPKSARVQAEYGRVLMEEAQAEGDAGHQSEADRLFSSAREHFETSLRIYPSYSPAMDGLATILADHQQFDRALTLYERAVRVWPGSYVSVANWAGLLWDRSRRLEAAAGQLRAEGRSAEADAAMRQSDAGYRQALDKVDQAIRMRSSYAHAHLIRALLLDGYVRDAAGAIAEFETVLRLQPDNSQRADIERELSRLRNQLSGQPAGSGGPTLEQPQ